MSRCRVAVVLAFALAGACRGGASRAVDDPLALLPVGAGFVVGVDLVRARQAPVAVHLASLKPVFADSLAEIGKLTAETGFDPWLQIDSIVFAHNNAADQTGLVIRGNLLDEKRAGEYMGKLLREKGSELVATKRGRLTLWSSRDRPGVAAFFADARTWLLGTGGWATKMADLVQGAPAEASAASNPELAKSYRSVREHPIWMVGEVPTDLRAAIGPNSRIQDTAEVAHVAVTVDLDKGIRGNLAAEFPSPEAADATAETVADWLVRERRHKKLDPVLKGVTAYVDSSTFRLTLALDERLVTTIGDAAAQIYGLARPKLARAAPASEFHAIKFTAANEEVWARAIAFNDIRTFSHQGQSFAMMEIVNRAARPIVPSIAVVYRDADGRSIKGESCVIPTLVVLPHEKMPCLVPAPAGAADANYSVALLPDVKAAALAGVVRANLRVLDARLESPPGPSQLVVGTVVNETRATLQGVRVQASFYDATRKLVGYGVTGVESALKPGAKARFEVRTGMLPSEAKAFTATAFVFPTRADRGPGASGEMTPRARGR